MTRPDDTVRPDDTPPPGGAPRRDLAALAALDDILAGRGAAAAGAEAMAARVPPEDLRLLIALRALAAERRAAVAPSAATMPERIGRYRIGPELGRGGFAVVHAATDAESGQPVAIKVLLPEALLSGSKRRRFEREAALCARLTHPGIVPLIEVGLEGSQPYIVSHLCSGGSLAAWLERHPGPLPPAAAARIVARLAHAVAHAHACRIIHRDIKPANVLLVPTTAARPTLADAAADGGCGWEVKLGDFGLGKLVHDAPPTADNGADDGTRAGVVLGSPEWMAPEQVDPLLGTVGPASDIHALGLLLDRLLTGRSRHAGERPSEAFRRLRDPATVVPANDPPGLPAELLAIRSRCLARRPEDRPPTAGVVAGALDAIAERV